MIACYLELYEEGEVEHINGPTHNMGLLSKGVFIGWFFTHAHAVSGACYIDQQAVDVWN